MPMPVFIARPVSLRKVQKISSGMNGNVPISSWLIGVAPNKLTRQFLIQNQLIFHRLTFVQFKGGMFLPYIQFLYNGRAPVVKAK